MSTLNTLKAILVEDEINNANLLKHFLTKYCPEIHLLDSCQNKEQAIQSINKWNPQLLFLDIILENETAFDLLQEIDYSNTHIVFITAFDEYALKAFRYNAADYLLKPIQIDELIAAVQRVLLRVKNNDLLNKSQMQDLSDSFHSQSQKFVTISNIDKVNFVKNEEIIYCQSSGRYTEFHLSDKRRLVASKSLGEYEMELDKGHFFRIHKSFIVNLNYNVNINKKAGNYCELSDGSSLPISRRRYDGLIQFIKNM